MLFESHISDKDLYLEYIKKPLNSSVGKQTIQLKNSQMWMYISPKRIYRWEDAQLCLLATREMQIKTTRWYHHIPIRMTKINDTDNIKC